MKLQTLNRTATPSSSYRAPYWKDSRITIAEKNKAGDVVGRVNLQNAQNDWGEDIGPVGDAFAQRILDLCPSFPLSVLHDQPAFNGTELGRGAGARAFVEQPYLGGALACIEPAFQNVTSTIDAHRPHPNPNAAWIFPLVCVALVGSFAGISRCCPPPSEAPKRKGPVDATTPLLEAGEADVQTMRGPSQA
jgi:hypothetical protein